MATKYKNNNFYDKNIKNLLKESQINIQNKISTILFKKNINFSKLYEIQKEIKNNFGIFYLVEGIETYLIILEDKNIDYLKNSFEKSIIKINKDLSLVAINSTLQIENIPGVISYLTSLLAENNVNIVEFLSCYKDTIFLIKKKDIQKIVSILNF